MRQRRFSSDAAAETRAPTIRAGTGYALLRDARDQLPVRAVDRKSRAVLRVER
jgi:hypothetical protein